MASERGGDPHIDETEFMEITGDQAQARELRKALEQLAAGGAGGTLSEMAREVLSGRVGLREAVNITSYSEAILEGAKPFETAWNSLSEAERDTFATEGEAYMERQRLEIEEEKRVRRQGGASDADSHQNSRPRHDGRGWSAY